MTCLHVFLSAQREFTSYYLHHCALHKIFMEVSLFHRWHSRAELRTFQTLHFKSNKSMKQAEKKKKNICHGGAQAPQPWSLSASNQRDVNTCRTFDIRKISVYNGMKAKSCKYYRLTGPPLWLDGVNASAADGLHLFQSWKVTRCTLLFPDTSGMRF